MGSDRESLIQELRRVLRAGMAGPEALSPAAFDALALRLFAYQYEENPVLRAYWEEQGVRPGRVRHWLEIPPLPVTAFKQATVFAGDPAEAAAVFMTSGTTRGPEERGRHYFRTLDLYRAALLPPFVHYLLPDGASLPIFVLAPSPAEAPHSSLSFYFGVIVETLGAPGSRFFWQEGQLLYQELAAALAAMESAGQPVLLLGTAFAFVHFLDWLAGEGRRFRLPPGSRAMETGGFKGRSREMPQANLYALMADGLGIPPERIVNQYGMCELSSQFYEPTLRGGPAGFPRPKQGPPWTRVVIRDPETLAPAAPGEVGLIQVVDLANLDSAAFLLTQDLGREVPGGFVVLGRAPGAVARGCSIAADLALGGGQGAPGAGELPGGMAPPVRGDQP
nr:MAG: hypothetical protein DIU70_03195 [Bacillota bacterium]